MNNKKSNKQKVKSATLGRIDTLIITVGTRQVGWHSTDNVVRCFGADGDRGAPPHIDELYRELGINRGDREPGKDDSLWGVRDLGERYYNHCVKSLQGDFSQVELLIDHKIIADGVDRGLKYIILWGTNQPDTVPWNFRRADTLWLAKLMAGKIQTKWPNVKVEVWEPVIAVTDNTRIRLELENEILPKAMGALSTSKEPFILAIQNKGIAPQIASALEICAAALVRQCQVLNITPIEPDPLYENSTETLRSANTCQSYKVISVGEYFWPLERVRVISAWERGDFREAEIWLTAHQSRYEGLLYKLAGHLALSTNWEISKFLENQGRGISSWLQLESLNNLVELDKIEKWKQQVERTRTTDYLQAWESSFLIDLQLRRGNYTTAFMQFAQTLERLLYIRAEEENWLERGLIEFSPGYIGNRSEPSFFLLINAWGKLNNFKPEDKWIQLLHRIREKRNEIVHKAHPLTPNQVKAVWSNDGLFGVKVTGNVTQDILYIMHDTMKKVCVDTWITSSQSLLSSLYEWGLNILRSETASS